MNPAFLFLLKELGRLIKGIGATLVATAIWIETGKRPTRLEMREIERRQVDPQQD